MEIKFNIEKTERKALARKIAEITENECIYLGTPSLAYQIGELKLDKDSVLSGEISDELLKNLHDSGYETGTEPR